LFGGYQLGCDGKANLSEFRLGGAAKFVPGEAKFVCTAIDFGELSRVADLGFRIADYDGADFMQLLQLTAVKGAHNYWLWVLRTFASWTH
jgi:hypothetical protein